MSRIVVSLNEAKAPQLREFLMTVKGAEVDGRDGIDKLKAMLQNIGYAEDFITVPDTRTLSGEPNDGRPVLQRRATDRKTADGETIYEVRVLLQTSDKAGGDQPVPVGLNGVVMLVPRGEPVWVREEYVEILKNSVEMVYDEYDQARNMMGGLDAPRFVSGYPFSYA